MRIERTKSTGEYGQWWTLYICGKHRVRWNSRKASNFKAKKFSRGSDENCNRSVSVMIPPLGHLDVWWETKWRTDADGMCDKCISEMKDMGVSDDEIARTRYTI